MTTVHFCEECDHDRDVLTPTYTASQVQDEKRKLVDEIAKNVQDYFAAGEGMDNCSSDKELDNWRYIREIAEFIREMKI